MRPPFLFLAAVGGFIGVAMGAFGAHGLKHLLSEHLLDVYKTAVSYQMWHVLVLALIAVLPEHKLLRWAGWCLVAGVVLFSGSLYLLAIFNIGWLGMITPLGGLAFLAAWALLAYVAWQKNQEL
ncbi:DUF423 domain-containing protein [Methylomonas fluvii]|uniref:DUF423 domain-containing protein n=1 Tax=Methylomonas fluvii TaxID=1854564 RepID=A0ABR9D7N0_9GAMM|nr:DUF423 domain-containing protein [Methylomonas fluvii]MBD9359120.1 DUF423 domain-containing protein [Methylomonas fluvii]